MTLAAASATFASPYTNATCHGDMWMRRLRKTVNEAVSATEAISYHHRPHPRQQPHPYPRPYSHGQESSPQSPNWDTVNFVSSSRTLTLDPASAPRSRLPRKHVRKQSTSDPVAELRSRLPSHHPGKQSTSPPPLSWQPFSQVWSWQQIHQQQQWQQCSSLVLCSRMKFVL